MPPATAWVGSNGATVKSAAAETESVEPAAVESAAAPDEAVSEGSKAAVCPSVRVAVAAFGTDWRRSTRLWLGRAQSLHVRDTQAGRANFKTVVAGVRTSCHSTRSNPDGWCFVDFWCDRFREIVFRMRMGGRISKFPGSTGARLGV
uniref:Uncharacterized protein n=1 Tax=Hyaloperonospora arabidopsidis (strain Emoy2) TaxID=559515 RepID=M4BJC4_HYAAE